MSVLLRFRYVGLFDSLGVISRESGGVFVVGVVVSRQGGVPAWALLGMVFDDAVGEIEVGDAVGVVAVGGVDCVGAVCAVGDGLFLSVRMLF